jgi:hypothetical protein
LGEGIRPQKGRKYKGISNSLFLALNAKGGENIKPKAKGPHHHFKIFKMNFSIDVFFKIFQIGIYFKTLLKAKKRIHSGGAFM